MLTIVQAIANFEGFNIPNSRARRNNNPGNINFGILAEQFGGVLETIPQGITEEARFALFPFAEAGWDCLRLLLNKNYLGMTVLDAFNKYAPSTENNTVSYAHYICKETGLALTDTLTNVNIG
jgi:methyl coenzyme M reductase alpha subunit